jgi:hypothetical protein
MVTAVGFSSATLMVGKPRDSNDSVKVEGSGIVVEIGAVRGVGDTRIVSGMMNSFVITRQTCEARDSRV